jgi:hypothetical protein
MLKSRRVAQKDLAICRCFALTMLQLAGLLVCRIETSLGESDCTHACTANGTEDQVTPVPVLFSTELSHDIFIWWLSYTSAMRSSQ